jgi:hypothetical protein
MTLEEELRAKLRRIEALFAGASTDGERLAAAAAMERIRRRLGDAEKRETAIEFRFTLADEWSRRLFVALCRRYGLEPYRYSRQRYTTVMVRAPKSFIEQTLWPEYREIQKALEQYLVDATTRIIREEVYKDSAEARER